VAGKVLKSPRREERNGDGTRYQT